MKLGRVGPSSLVAFGAAALAAVTVIALHGFTGASIVWIIALFVVLLIIENLPQSSQSWRIARFGAAMGVVLGWFAVVYLFGAARSPVAV